MYLIHKALQYGIWARVLVTTSGFKAGNRFIYVYEDPVLFSDCEMGDLCLFIDKIINGFQCNNNLDARCYRSNDKALIKWRNGFEIN